MYFTDITNKELLGHGVKVPNFTIKLTDILTSDLFKVEEIITDKLYKIYPLFRTNRIESTNPNDKIFDNKLIIAQKKTTTTYITFISNEDEEIVDYIEYGTYFDIGDTLTMAEFNMIVQLIRETHVEHETITISDNVVGENGTYKFTIPNAIVTDEGILLPKDDLTTIGTVKLTNPIFSNSEYVLECKVKHYIDINIDETVTDNVVIDTVTVTLETDTAKNISYETSEDYQYTLLTSAEVTVNHNKPVIVYPPEE